MIHIKFQASEPKVVVKKKILEYFSVFLWFEPKLP